MKSLYILTITFAIALISSSAIAQENNVTILYLFRHAETIPPPYSDNPPNPKLSDLGIERAVLLKNNFRDIAITKIFSSDYTRTKMTVEPLSISKNLEIDTYNPRELEDFALRLKQMEGIIVISGHSNTTPELVDFLGGDAGPKIDHTIEYDRLYIVVIQNGETISSQLLRYGKDGLKED